MTGTEKIKEPMFYTEVGGSVKVLYRLPLKLAHFERGKFKKL